MKNWEQTLISSDISVRDAIQNLETTGLQIAIVVDSDHNLKGVVTDSDVRRGILRGVSLDEPVKSVMNPTPTTAGPHDDRDALLSLMRKKRLHQIPILVDGSKVVGLEVLDNLLKVDKRDNAVVLMAGGLGKRLRPLTDDCPKPMLKVGQKPILETILENFVDYGFRRFYISVNYRAEMIVEYFGNGAQWDAEIEYLVERDPMGTAGALSLLPDDVSNPIIVMNSDLLTKLNFECLLDFHRSNEATATMCVREYDMQVPYGVVQTKSHRIVNIREKPVERFFVNAGVYVLQPDALESIPSNSHLDMTDLFRKLADEGKPTAVFPIHEYWMDIGQMEDFIQANGDFDNVFEE